MKKLFVLLVSVLFITSSCKVSSQNQGQAPFMTRSFPSSSIKGVEATTSGGSITLTGDADSKAIVEVYVSRHDWSEEKIKKIFEENYTMDIKVESGKLYVMAKQKKSNFSWDQQGLSISYKILVPKQINSNLQTSGGSIHINDLSGSQNIKTSGGSLSINNVSGNTVGTTSGGSINVTGSRDIIELKTSGGSITAKNCSGKIDLKTSGGSLHISDLDGIINASTSGGSVTASDLKGTIKTGTSGGSMRLTDISGNIEATTSGGSMHVKIASAGDFVKLSNSGNISLSLPAGKGYNLNVKANKIESSGLKDFHGNLENRSIQGTVGIGGSEISVKSSQRVNLSFE